MIIGDAVINDFNPDKDKKDGNGKHNRIERHGCKLEMKRDISKHLFSAARSIAGGGIAIFPSAGINVLSILYSGSVPAMLPESPIALNIWHADFAD